MFRSIAFQRKGGLAISQVAVVFVGVFTSALLLYLFTGAPSVVSGDQAEHQFTAQILGVPHATGYPLFTMLNALGARLIPFGDVARRVTIMVALYSALGITAALWVVRQLTGSSAAGVLAAAVLAVSPEYWQLSTFAEVYTLQVFFILATWWAVLRWWRLEATEADLGINLRGLKHPLSLACLLAGLGATHHGSFTPVTAPALMITVAVPLLLHLRHPKQRSITWRLFGRCVLWFALGFTPWLYLVAQFAFFQPFDYYRGTESLPYHLYWGNPEYWGDVLNLALGAGFRLKVFTHGWDRLPELLPRYINEIREQFWWTGMFLGVVGAISAWRMNWRIGVWSTLVWLGGSFFGLNVAADVPKAHVYYLPAWVIWSIWIGLGAWTLAVVLVRQLPQLSQRLVGPSSPLVTGFLILMLVVPLGRTIRRYESMDRSGDWWHRTWGEAALASVEDDAVILCRWEECMTLRYLQFVDGHKLGVQLDQTEPEAGINWATRVPIYDPLPIYAVRPNDDLAAEYPLLPVESVPNEFFWQVRR